MKRHNHLYESICSIDNLILAESKARKGKSHQYGVQVFDKSYAYNMYSLHRTLISNTYKTSEYTTFKLFDGKERLIHRLPFYPDRICHHALMNILEPIFVSTFTSDTYSCIKGRGIHAAANRLKTYLKDLNGTTYCLKLDIQKFYPSIDHDILKQLIRRKFKDRQLLALLDEIIESTAGVPIGNYLSQYFANFYLSGLDHWLKARGVKYYLRYADDMVILSNDKKYLHVILADIREYLTDKLKLKIKDNYQVFPVKARGIDFVGYVFYHTHVKLRKTIKQRFARMLRKNPNKESTASYNGWLKHCDARHLEKKLLGNSFDNLMLN